MTGSMRELIYISLLAGFASGSNLTLPSCPRCGASEREVAQGRQKCCADQKGSRTRERLEPSFLINHPFAHSEPMCDGHHKESDLGAISEPVHRDAESIEPVWLHRAIGWVRSLA